MRRRDVLGLAAAAPLAWPCRAAASEGGPSRLVVVMLRGAVDGLNVVIPQEEAEYYRLRPTIAVPRGAALPLDRRFALHPALAGLMPLWQAGQLAFVHAAGSPDPTRSHFDAQLFIENGTPGRRTTADGWLNRLLAALPGPHGPAEALAVGPTLPTILRGRLAAANLPLGRAGVPREPLDRPALAGAFDRLYAGDDAQSRAYREGRAAHSELAAHMEAEQQMADAGAPPAAGFPAIAARLARLVAGDRRIRLVFAALGGWDTHVAQGGETGQLASRLKPLGDGLAAFAKELGGDWRDTVVVVVSEFGRTAAENGNGGTDHGHGNAIWVLGGRVAGGRVYGDWPGLAAGQLHEGRDLAVTTDYRSVFAAVIERHLRLGDRALPQIFPDAPPPRANLKEIIAA
jgi:uncharacterized protein (DUF1501 family)